MSWSELGSELEQTGERAGASWSELEQAGVSWSKLERAGVSWSKLERAE